MTQKTESSTVLIVEDEEPLANMYASKLRSKYEVEVVHNAQAGFEVVAANGIDIILLDRRLPGLSGDEFLTEIRQRGVSCPVVMITAVEPDVDLLWLDFDDYILKPAKEGELIDAVEHNLKLTDYQEPIQEYLKLAETQQLIAENNPESQLREHEEYQSVLRRLEELRGEVAEIVEEVDEDEFVKMGIRDLWMRD